MGSYVPFQVILIAAVGANIVPFSGNTQPPSTTTEDSKLVIGFGNDHGQHRNLEIRISDIPKANLSSLTNWLEYMDQLKILLRNIRTNDSEYYLSNAPPGDRKELEFVDVPHESKVDQSIKLVEEFERQIETELRKPEKDWNYSVEKD